jgi:hypothetical protein
MRYFAMLDTEEVVLIGEFEDIADVFNKEPPRTHWIFSEEGLRTLAEQIERALK